MQPSITSPVCPKVVHSWVPESIKIPGVDRNLCDVFWPTFGAKESIVFPGELYPPNKEEGKDSVVSAIKEAAQKQADTTLIVVRTHKRTNEFQCHLVCELGYSHRVPTPKDGSSGKENSGSFKDGVRKDRMVGKEKSSRGPQGKAGPKRTRSSKPKPGEICLFKFVLRLVIGEHWCLKKHNPSFGCHNHERVGIEAKVNRRMLTYSVEERQTAARFSQVCHSGSAQTLTQDETGTFAPTRQQLHHNRKTIENRGQKLSQAETLINQLNKHVENRHMRWIGLFCEVELYLTKIPHSVPFRYRAYCSTFSTRNRLKKESHT